MLVGSLRTSGVTTYLKQGKLITRSSTAYQKRSNTMPQFVQRQKMRHSVSLWMMLKYCKTMFTQRPTAYNNFMSLANRLPVLYVDKLNDQASSAVPRVRFSMREISSQEMTVLKGCLAMVSEEFADEMKGWALVRVIDDRCSAQTIVTRCTLYQQYTTEEALQAAAKSYGGLTETPFPSPQ